MSARSVSGEAWPNLFIVGAARAGTTSLWRYLDRHPEIWMASVKEPNFFSGTRHKLSQEVHDRDAYLKLFEPGRGSKLRGEASPSYLWSEGVAARIKERSAHARILISLRDPVERAYSAYWLFVLNRDEDRPFSDVVRDELENPGRLLRSSLYADNVSRYLGTFPGAVHVLFLERLARDPRREMRRVFDFLGVDPAVADRLDATVHNLRAVRRGRLADMMHNSRRLREVAWRTVPVELRMRAQRLLVKRSPRDEMEPETEALLTECFAPDVERLRTLLGEDPPWPRFSRTGLRTS